jgi:putative transposase
VIAADHPAKPARSLVARSGTFPALPAGVTAPRQVCPDTTYLVTRRCSERRFFLRPCAHTTATFLYVLAVAARLHQVEIHAVCVLSNHFHLLLTDRLGRLPAFMQYLDSLVARALNAALGRCEGFWSSDASYSAVSQGDAEDILRKATYVLANPVAAGLVSTAREWPGLWTAPEQLGSATILAPRPKGFFSENGNMPKVAELALTLPPGFSSVEEFQSAVAERLRDAEREERRTRGKHGFLGAKKVLRQSPFAQPVSREPNRKLNPRIAAHDKWKRLEAITRLKDFLREYRAAWLQWRDGVRDVVFPPGTYQLRVQHGVRCSAPG